MREHIHFQWRWNGSAYCSGLGAMLSCSLDTIVCTDKSSAVYHFIITLSYCHTRFNVSCFLSSLAVQMVRRNKSCKSWFVPVSLSSHLYTIQKIHFKPSKHQLPISNILPPPPLQSTHHSPHLSTNSKLTLPTTNTKRARLDHKRHNLIQSISSRHRSQFGIGIVSRRNLDDIRSHEINALETANNSA